MPPSDPTRGTSPTGDGATPGNRPGDSIGPYKLLHVVGEGGFGIVWVAERREPMVQRVAIKIIKPGMDSREVIARFEQERQALAVMDNPHVAKVFDGGITPGGHPYFVMEHVAGEPITIYCDRQMLTIRERLGLFLQVCEAVQHAHLKGLIHRDLKPSNVLVMVRDAMPVCKVIDFGVAKAISHAFTDKTIFTETGRLIGTPEYMSPEQAEMGTTDIDARTDVYSLGVLLYELLAGVLPLDSKTLRAAGYGAIQKMIREQEPARPSTRLSTVDDKTAAEIARHRQRERENLARELRRELDWIPMKALRKDRTERYETPSDLARDVRRYLAGEPLEAGPESAAYRLRKFARRNRAFVSSAGAVLLALVLGLVATLWMAGREATRAREAVAAEGRALAAGQAADNERRRAEALNTFIVNNILLAPTPEESRGRVLTVREVLDRALAQVDGALASDPEAQSAVRCTLGAAYGRIGEPAIGLEQLRRGIAQHRSLHPEPDERLASALTEVVRTYIRSHGQADAAEALAAAREAAGILEHLKGEGDPLTARARMDVAWVESTISGAGHLDLFDPGTLALSLQVCGSTVPLQEFQLAITHLIERNDELWKAGRQAEAIEGIRRFHSTMCPNWRAPYIQNRATFSEVGVALGIWEKTYYMGAAEAQFKFAEEVALSVKGVNSPELLLCRNRYAAFLIDQRRLNEALPLIERQVRDCTAVLGEKGGETLEAHCLHAICRSFLGDPGAASLVPDSDSGDWLNQVAWEVVRTPDAPPAAYEIAARLAGRAAASFPNHPDVMNTLGIAQYRVGKYADAASSLRASARSRAPSRPLLSDDAFTAMSMYKLGRNDEALQVWHDLHARTDGQRASLTRQDASFLAEADALLAIKP